MLRYYKDLKNSISYDIPFVLLSGLDQVFDCSFACTYVTYTGLLLCHCNCECPFTSRCVQASALSVLCMNQDT